MENYEDLYYNYKTIHITRKYYWFNFLDFSKYHVSINDQIVGLLRKGETLHYHAKQNHNSLYVDWINAGQWDFLTLSSKEMIVDFKNEQQISVEIGYSKSYLSFLPISLFIILGAFIYSVVNLTLLPFIITLILFLFFNLYYTFTPGHLIHLRITECK